MRAHEIDPLNKIFFVALTISLLVHLIIFVGPGDLFRSRQKTIIFAPYRVKLVGHIGRAGSGNTKKTGASRSVTKRSSKKSSVKAVKKKVLLRKSMPAVRKKGKVISLTRKKKRSVKRTRESTDLAELGQIIKEIKKKNLKKERGGEGGGAVKGNSNGYGGGGQLGAQALSVLQRIYFTDLAGKIKDAWILPDQLKNEKRNLVVVVDITISSSGKILDAKIEKTSGNIFYDESALRAVKKLGQLPPPPISGDKITIGLRFYLKELQQ